MKSKNNSGLTIAELVIAIAIVAIVALFVAPQIGLVSSNYNVRLCSTDLIQNIRTARAMAIKENTEYLIVFDVANQRYLIGFDDDGDNDLISVTDGYGPCVGTACIRTVNVNRCGNGVQFGTQAPNGPGGPADGLCSNGLDVCFGTTASPIRTDFNPDGSVGNLGSVYFEQTTRDNSYVVRISTSAGATNMWKWDGDENNLGVTTWTEMR